MALDAEKGISTLLKSGGAQGPAKMQRTELERLCAICESIFDSEPMLLELQGPLMVVGNLHGTLGRNFPQGFTLMVCVFVLCPPGA